MKSKVLSLVALGTIALAVIAIVPNQFKTKAIVSAAIVQPTQDTSGLGISIMPAVIPVNIKVKQDEALQKAESFIKGIGDSFTSTSTVSVQYALYTNNHAAAPNVKMIQIDNIPFWVVTFHGLTKRLPATYNATNPSLISKPIISNVTEWVFVNPNTGNIDQELFSSPPA